jgi:hypothetical protein
MMKRRMMKEDEVVRRMGTKEWKQTGTEQREKHEGNKL